LNLQLSRHARNRMRLYGVTRDDVLACLENPDKHATEVTGEKSYQHAWMNAVDIQWKRRTGEFLEVVYVVEVGVHVIITLGPRDEAVLGGAL
jgi:hypothetical protein